MAIFVAVRSRVRTITETSDWEIEAANEAAALLAAQDADSDELAWVPSHESVVRETDQVRPGQAAPESAS